MISIVVENCFSLTIALRNKNLLVQLFYENERSPSATLKRIRKISKIKSENDGPCIGALVSPIESFKESGSVEDKPRS